MSINRQSSLSDVCFAVCTALHNIGTVAVLTGGSAATYYSPKRYQSHDADFIITISSDRAAAAEAIRALGFREEGGIYKHPDTLYTLEFPPGPLAVGETIITKYDTVYRKSEILHVLTRADTICLCLAKYFHWGDRSSLRTALDVAQSGDFDLKRVERWSRNEGALEKIDEFLTRYAGDVGQARP